MLSNSSRLAGSVNKVPVNCVEEPAEPA